ncbi:cytochrome-c peroxidase [Tenacibaculum piscium]|uniref:Methylamine utilization protein n=1 Tax=Tenacibaculum piscium TaxID=1458515 RepID=A0A2H1YET0_9FLAO|nr:cytochrome c peroxidase [Tenacibaculum piscium]MBE7628839.1 methylamine utilization protein [Tenacibaculum piscium]MBE7671142.1 methylamine utilization protein [Tenacibaculum piscium]MBE7685139.1 methylamine utilization protein [Tenacibaculum piscium]MBE7689842.1 methylamine utilization protein [Tenacibaculum piscium]SOS73998.1 Methylamine utilization protein [Tenacibaculum piscium]
MKDLYSQAFCKAKTYIRVCLLLLLVACNQKSTKYQAVNNSLNSSNSSDTYFSDSIQKIYVENLNITIKNLDSIEIKEIDIKKKQAYYGIARKYFKRLEPILAFSDKNNYKSLNAPNIVSVKGEASNDTRVMQPIGFQVIEEAIYQKNIDTVLLKRAVTVTRNRLKLIRKNVALNLKSYHVMWLIRDQITRIATTGITGFDSPVLNQSLQESLYTYGTILEILQVHQQKFSNKKLLTKFETAIKNAQKDLKHDFDTFDRFTFIQKHTNPQLKLLLEIQKDWNVKYPFEMALSNNMATLFSDKTLNLAYFSDHLSDTTQLAEKIIFGEQLFNDPSLSKKYDMACATCHVKDLAFTDGRKKFNDAQQRNTPTLTYASYQRDFFMDARAGSLEGQIIGVVENHNEFNMTMDSVIQRVLKNQKYQKSLATLYQKNQNNGRNIRHAIASYIRTLNSFNSKFDKNIRGEEKTLTADEQRGFNLFMGKALCATCHFPPVFNGTVPPNYNDTELEFIGVPETIDTKNPVLSSDLGRYNLYKTQERKHFFKTPTIRNINKTAPYMHNGVYQTLAEVMDFYNKGGGVGLGIHNEYQTLPFDSLSLSKKEVLQVIDFMKTLSDENNE